MSTLSRMERFDNMFPALFRCLARPLARADDTPAEIRLDITENDKGYQRRAETPGAKSARSIVVQ